MEGHAVANASSLVQEVTFDVKFDDLHQDLTPDVKFSHHRWVHPFKDPEI